MNLSFWLNQQEYRVTLEGTENNVYQAAVGDKKFRVGVEFLGEDELLLNIDGKVFNVTVHSNAFSHSVFLNDRLFRVEMKSGLRALREEKAGHKRLDVKISMPGRVVDVLAGEGEEVEGGQAIIVLEAMKMQNDIKSPRPGKVIKVNFKAGDYVEAGSVLFSME